MSGYDALTLRVAARDVDWTVAELWVQGTLGLESHDEAEAVVLRAYFEPEWLRLRDWRLGTMTLGGRSIEVVAIESLEERDWLVEYRKQATPFALGRGFWVDPGEPDGRPTTAPAGRRLLRLPARRAFGTGSHESSRLVVEILESAAPPAGRRVLDVGAGSGLLSFISSHLGAEAIVGIERDSAATVIALGNQSLNRMRFPLVTGTIDCLAPSPVFDMALVNVIPERIARDLGAIAERLATGAVAIFSGCLVERSESYRACLERAGFRTVDTQALGEWCALVTEVTQS